MESTTSYLEPGTLLAGRYRIESVLGKGGMGAVYLGKLESLGQKPVAIKEMCLQHNDPKAQQQAIEQFQQEARFLAHLEHPNLVQVSDYFDEGGRHYLVMAYVKGKTLQEMLQARRGAFPVATVLDWGCQLAGVLSFLHKQDPPILFRDLKPANIMLDETGKIRLIDFGIARSHAPDGVTATFMQGMGSAGYSPLEQYQGAGGTDPRSDIYALGATLFHLLTNKLPPSPVELIAEGKPMPSPRRWNPTMPAALDQVLHKMLAVRKDERYSSMAEVQTLFKQIEKSLDEEEPTENLGSVTITSAAPVTLTGQALPTQAMAADPNEKLVWLTMGTLSAVLIMFMGWMVWQGRSTPATTPLAKSTAAPILTPAPVTSPRVEASPKKSLPVRPLAKQPVPKPAKPLSKVRKPDPQPSGERPSLSPNLPDGSYPTGSRPLPSPKKILPPAPQVEETPQVVVVKPPEPAPPEPSQHGRTNYNPPGNPYAKMKDWAGKREGQAPPLVGGWGPPIPDGKGGWMPDPNWIPPHMMQGGGGFGPSGPPR